MIEKVSFNIGHEYDVELWRNLFEIVKKLGGTINNDEWGLAGSQEVTKCEAVFEKSIVLIESETYIGLSITGDKNLINKILENLRV